MPMLGRYNLDNALAASAAALAYGLSLEKVLQGLATFRGVPGRMEVVQKKPFRVVIDFAHTGKSLEEALKTLRATTRGRLLLVVGAAGERDPRRREDIGRAFFSASSRSRTFSPFLGTLNSTLRPARR